MPTSAVVASGKSFSKPQPALPDGDKVWQIRLVSGTGKLGILDRTAAASWAGSDAKAIEFVDRAFKTAPKTRGEHDVWDYHKGSWGRLRREKADRVLQKNRL